MERLRDKVSRELGAVICSLMGEIIPASGVTVVRLVVVVGSVVGGWKVVAFSEPGLPGLVGWDVIPAGGADRVLVPGEAARGSPVRKASQPPEPGFLLEIDDASLGLMRGADSENPIYP